MKTRSKNGLIRKKIRLTIQKLLTSLASSPERFIITILFGFSICLVLGLFSSFRLISLAIVVTVVLIGYQTRSLFMGGFIMLLFTLPLVVPNKFYYVTIIPGFQLLLSQLKTGYVVGYGMLPSGIALACCLVFAVRDLWKRKKTPPGRLRPVFTVMGISLVGFGLIAFPAAFYRSPFPALSVTWTVQYMQYYLIALMFLHAWIHYRNRFHLVYTTLFLSVVLEFGVSMWQFIHQAGTGLPIETIIGTSFAQGLDENNAIFRVSGTFLYHNQLALISLVYATVLLLALLETRHLIYAVGILLCGIIILLTQSRSVWIIAFILLVWIIKNYKKALSAIFRYIPIRRVIFYGALLAIAFGYIYIPRILLSVNVGYKGAGIPIRLTMIREALTAFTFSPWIGYGAGTNEYVLHTLSPLGYTSVFPAAVHMAYLQLLLEFGVLGMAAFVLPSFMVLRTYINALLEPGGKTGQKKFVFMKTFLYGSLAYAIYYLFQPHVGFIEFPFFGIILGFGLIGVYNITNT